MFNLLVIFFNLNIQDPNISAALGYIGSTSFFLQICIQFAISLFEYIIYLCPRPQISGSLAAPWVHLVRFFRFGFYQGFLSLEYNIAHTGHGECSILPMCPVEHSNLGFPTVDKISRFPRKFTRNLRFLTVDKVSIVVLLFSFDLLQAMLQHFLGISSDLPQAVLQQKASQEVYQKLKIFLYFHWTFYRCNRRLPKRFTRNIFTTVDKISITSCFAIFIASSTGNVTTKSFLGSLPET